MNTTLRWMLLGSFAASAITGLGYAALRYLLRNDDPFSAYNHPWQPTALAWHVLLGPAVVFLLGWIFAAHVAPHLRGTRRARLTGLLLIGSILVMVISGYLLPLAGGGGGYAICAWVHGLSGTLVLGSVAAHLVDVRRHREAIDTT